MEKNDILEWIEKEAQSFDERASGNEVNTAISAKIRTIVAADRGPVIEALRQLVSLRIRKSERNPENAIREARMWLALEIAADNGLAELKGDLVSLIADVRKGAAFSPYYEEMLAKYLARLDERN